MAWRGSGDKPLSETLMASLRRIYASIDLNELKGDYGVRSNSSLACSSHWYVTWYTLTMAVVDSYWAFYQICNIRGCACAGNSGNVFPATVGYRSCHESRHVRHARAVLYAGFAKLRFLLKSTAGKRFRHSRCMRNPQFYVSGKRPMPIVEGHRGRDPLPEITGMWDLGA